MKSINFNTGIKEYAVNGNENDPIRINVADMNLPKRIRDAMPKVEKLLKKFSGRSDNDISPDEIAETDAEIRNIVNEAFGADICTPAFGNINILSPVESGEPIFKVFFEAFMPIIEADIKAAVPKNAARPEVQKYIEPASVPDIKPIAGLSKPYGAEINVNDLTSEQRRSLIAQLLA